MAVYALRIALSVMGAALRRTSSKYRLSATHWAANPLLAWTRASARVSNPLTRARARDSHELEGGGSGRGGRGRDSAERDGGTGRGGSALAAAFVPSRMFRRESGRLPRLRVVLDLAPMSTQTSPRVVKFGFRFRRVNLKRRKFCTQTKPILYTHFCTLRSSISTRVP